MTKRTIGPFRITLSRDITGAWSLYVQLGRLGEHWWGFAVKQTRAMSFSERYGRKRGLRAGPIYMRTIP